MKKNGMISWMKPTLNHKTVRKNKLISTKGISKKSTRKPKVRIKNQSHLTWILLIGQSQIRPTLTKKTHQNYKMLNSMSKTNLKKIKMAAQPIFTHSKVMHSQELIKRKMSLDNSPKTIPKNKKIRALMKLRCTREKEKPKSNRLKEKRMLKFPRVCSQALRKVIRLTTVEAQIKTKMLKEELLLREKVINLKEMFLDIMKMLKKSSRNPEIKRIKARNVRANSN